MSGRAFRAQREDSIRRTVYVSEIDHNVSELVEYCNLISPQLLSPQENMQ